MEITKDPQEIEKAVYSRTFIREKLIRIIISGLLIAALVFLWNWENPTQVETTGVANGGTSNPIKTTSTNDTKQTPQVQTTPEVVTPVQPAVPLFPYEITLPAGATAKKQIGTDAAPAYEYTMADGAVMTIYPEGTAPTATDIQWQYNTAVSGQITIKEVKDQLCTAGTAGCAAGNGKYEISVVPVLAADKLVIKIVDSNIATKTPAQVAAQYAGIVNTLRIVK